ncbi:MAG TPA: hydantoinase/oxoprolinase N-terminal domain-containing protein, partial [Vicinamibacteria bacterium]
MREHSGSYLSLPDFAMILRRGAHINMEGNAKCRAAIDIGGTFTDLVLHREGEGISLAKVPSTPPDYSRGVVEALTRKLDSFEEMSLFVHGTTAQLNAFLERKGVRTALLTTRGFGDVYSMGRGSR